MKGRMSCVAAPFRKAQVSTCSYVTAIIAVTAHQRALRVPPVPVRQNAMQHSGRTLHFRGSLPPPTGDGTKAANGVVRQRSNERELTTGKSQTGDKKSRLQESFPEAGCSHETG